MGKHVMPQPGDCGTVTTKYGSVAVRIIENYRSGFLAERLDTITPVMGPWATFTPAVGS